MSVDLTEAVFEPAIAAARAAWGGRTIVVPGAVRHIPPVRDHGATHQLIGVTVEATVPIVEKAVRASIAAEIEAAIAEGRQRREEWITRQKPEQVLKYTVALAVLEHAARVARGEG